MIATVALAFGGVIQAAATPEAQTASTTSKSSTVVPEAAVQGEKAKPEKLVPAYKLMTQQEREAFRAKMRTAKTPQERQALRVQQRKMLEKRAEARGEKLRPLAGHEAMSTGVGTHEKKVPEKQDQHPAP
ncbi:MAG: hypothetical protein ABI304_14785 [Rudaea sp.]